MVVQHRMRIALAHLMQPPSMCTTDIHFDILLMEIVSYGHFFCCVFCLAQYISFGSASQTLACACTHTHTHFATCASARASNVKAHGSRTKMFAAMSSYTREQRLPGAWDVVIIVV